MTAEQYAQLGANVHAALVAIIASVVRPDGDVPKGLVLDRDPVNLDESQWLGALKSDDDLDENGDKRTHAWVIRFGGSLNPERSAVRSIEPKWLFDVQVFLTHDFGKSEGDGPYTSEAAIRTEVLKVQKALADSPKLNDVRVQVGGDEYVYIRRHGDLSMRLKLAHLGREIVHRGIGEITVELQPTPRG